MTGTSQADAPAPLSGPVEPGAARYLQRLAIPGLVAVAVAALVALLEIDRLIGAIVVRSGERQGQSGTLADATGLTAWGNRSVWEIWQAAAQAEAAAESGPSVVDYLAPLTTAYVLLDVVFFCAYLALAAIFVWRAPMARVLLPVLAMAEIVEGAALLAAVNNLGEGGAPIVVAVAAYAKWGALALVLIGAFGHADTRRDLGARLRRGLVAVRVHGLAVAFLIVVGALTLVSRSGIFDQLPDVQREWAGAQGVATSPIAWAAIAVAFAAVSLWLLGRRRSEVARRDGLETLPEASAGWWVALPFGMLGLAGVAAVAQESRGQAGWLLVPVIVVTLLVGLLADRAGDAWSRPARPATPQHPARPSGRLRSLGLWAVTALLFAGVLTWAILVGQPHTDFGPIGLVGGAAIGVVAVSWLLAKFAPEKQEAPQQDDDGTPGAGEDARLSATARTVWLTGDAIAVFVLALVPLGLLRSFFVPVVLYSLGLIGGDGAGYRVPATGLLVSGVLLLLAFVPLSVAAIWAFDRRVLGGSETHGIRGFFDPRASSAETLSVNLVTDVGAVLVGIAVVAFALLQPELFATVGPVAATVLVLSGWLCLLGGVILSLQRHRPMRVFRQIGLRTTPVLTLVLVCGLITSLFLTDPRVHAVRTSPEAPPQTSSISGSGSGADDQADERFRVALEARFTAWKARAGVCRTEEGAFRPLILVAAAGGGGRAAYWTVASLDAFRTAAAGTARCLSRSLFAASGISGGSVGLVMDQVATKPVATMDDLISPEPLARVVTGLLAGDVVAGYTGVRMPTVDDRWTDRAGLLETGWENATGASTSRLADVYTGEAALTDPFLLLNSADAVSGCRVTVVQLKVEPPTSAPGGRGLSADDCGRTDTGAAYTVAFDEVWPQCSGRLNWSTVALLSARFPYVTPGGRMPIPEGGACASGLEAQLVDGGYSEDTGLATLADLLPELIAIIEDHNAVANVDVLPMVMYLKNDLGFELDAALTEVASETLVPLSGLAARTQQNREAAWLQRVADQLEEVEVEDLPSDLENLRVVVVAPSTVPGTVPPLGWTLSKFSRLALQQGVKDQLTGPCRFTEFLCLSTLIAVGAGS